MFTTPLSSAPGDLVSPALAGQVGQSGPLSGPRPDGSRDPDFPFEPTARYYPLKRFERGSGEAREAGPFQGIINSGSSRKLFECASRERWLTRELQDGLLAGPARARRRADARVAKSQVVYESHCIEREQEQDERKPEPHQAGHCRGPLRHVASAKARAPQDAAEEAGSSREESVQVLGPGHSPPESAATVPIQRGRQHAGR